MLFKRNINATAYTGEITTPDPLLQFSEWPHKHAHELAGVNDSNKTFDFHTPDTEEFCVDCIIVPILLISCLISMLVNVVVIASAKWIRSPMTPNLKISLSLAGADAFSSSMYGLLVLIDSYVIVNLGVFMVVVDLLRMCGIVITVIHLLALSLNHYIGILKPLHYNSIVTSKKVTALIWLLWICPTVIILSICMAFNSDDNILDNMANNAQDTVWDSIVNNTQENPRFLQAFSFRITYSSLFFVPIFIMVVCYTHILIVVKRQQSKWNNLSRIGSTRIKGKPSQKISRERKQLEGNVRAIYTTLLILGSCFLGWTPALLFFILACPIGCFIEGVALTDLNYNHKNLIMVLRLVENTLLILKMLANPIIYSIRMKEIKDGTRRMLFAIAGLCCRYRRGNLDSYYYRSRTPNASSSTIQMRMSLKSMKNGNHVALGNESDNTFL